MSLYPTLEFVNFHKSFQDVAGFDELDEWKQYGPQIYDELNNFRLMRLEYYDQIFDTIFLSAPSVRIIQQLGEGYRNIKYLPLMHIARCPSVFIQDSTNATGHGPTTIIQFGFDGRKCLVVAKSFKEFLENHLENLQKNWYTTHRGAVENFCTDPSEVGSITKTQGIIIKAHAVYNHLVTKYCSLDGDVDRFLFAYQITISVDEECEEFVDCQLTTRTWIIEKGEEVDKVENQPGLIGMYPSLKKGMKPFVYESQCMTHLFGTKMSGHFMFRTENGEEIKALIDPFLMKLPEG